MPGNHESEQLSGNLFAGGNGDGRSYPERQNAVAGDEPNGVAVPQPGAPRYQEANSAEFTHAESKEDMFVDAPEELNVDTPGKEAQVFMTGDEGFSREVKEESEDFSKDIAQLQEQLKALNSEKLWNGEQQDRNAISESSLKETFSQFSEFLRSAKGKWEQHENTVKELQGVIYGKDREIAVLYAQVSELSSHGNSVSEAETQAQHEKNQHIEAVADRMLASLSTLASQEQLSDDSFGGKVTHLETCISKMLDNYNQALLGIDQLRKCLSEEGSNRSIQEEFGSVLGDACSELLELRKREKLLVEKMNDLEDQNKKLFEKMDKDREIIEAASAELGKVRTQLEQEKNRCANTKEKLSMAVTKGKALVQQRDTLKQSVVEKTNELEKCMIELQEKTNALEAAEWSKVQMEQSLAAKTKESEKLSAELLAKSAELETFEQDKAELEQSLADRTQRLQECLSELQEKSNALEAFELSKVELDTLLQKNLTVESFEAILSQINLPEQVQELDIVDQVRWLAEERNELERKHNRLKDAIHSLDIPEEIPISDLESRLSWLKESFFQAKNEVNVLKSQIERLSSSLSTEMEEKYSIQKDQDALLYRIEEMKEKMCQVSSERDHMIHKLLEISGLTSEGVTQMSDKAMVIDTCLGKIKEQGNAYIDTLQANAEVLERMQSLLYVKDQELSLYEEILDYEMLVKSQVKEIEIDKSGSLVASLEESLSQKNLIVENFEAVLSQIDMPEEAQAMDAVERIKWVADEMNELKGVYLEYNRLKESILMIDAPEDISSLDLESRLGWFKESFFEGRKEITMLQSQIESLSSSLSAEMQQKDSIQKELEALAHGIEEMKEKVHQVSSEKDEMLKKLLETSELELEDRACKSPDTIMLLDRCFGKIKEQACANFDTDQANAEVLVKMQSLLYVKYQESTLYEVILDNEMLVNSKVLDLSDQLRVASQKLLALKEEKDALQKDLERSEEKSVLLREKLSMAVKKGKGLVQDRENLKLQLDEKNTEIEKLKLELKQLEHTVGEFRGKIDLLSADSECIPKLEADLVSAKDRQDELEQLLSDGNNMLQKLKESIDNISVPMDSNYEDSLEKVNFLAWYLNECQIAKAHAQEELEKMKVEISTLSSKLADAQETLKSTEGELSSLENNNVKLSEEKLELEVSKKNIELELQRAIEEAGSLANKFSEACSTRKSLEEALLQAENRISDLVIQMEETQGGRAAAETELEKSREEVANGTSKLADANDTIRSLQDELLQAKTHISELVSEKEENKGGRDVEIELDRIREELACQTSKLKEAHDTIKLLKDELKQAESHISKLFSEKEEAQGTRDVAVRHLEQLREEVAEQTSKLKEAHDIIKSLEKALSEAQSNAAILVKQHNDAKFVQTNLENELKQLKNEAESGAGKLVEASMTVKSLEEALTKAEHDLSVLQGEKIDAQTEISTLNSKFKACMAELDGVRGDSHIQTSEIFGQLEALQVLLKHDNLYSRLSQCFESKFRSLNDVNLVVDDTSHKFVEKGLAAQQINDPKEDDLYVPKPLTNGLAGFPSTEMGNTSADAVSNNNIWSCFRMIEEDIKNRNNILLNNIDSFSDSFDILVAALLRKAIVIKDAVVNMFGHVDLMEQEVEKKQIINQEMEETMSMLEKDVEFLLSACSQAVKGLQIHVNNSLVDFSYITEPQSIDEQNLDTDDVRAYEERQMHGSKCMEAAKELSSTTKKVCSVIRSFERASKAAAGEIQHLQDKLRESIIDAEKAVEERDQCQHKVLDLEAEVESLKVSCRELRLTVKDLQAKEVEWLEKEAEVSSKYKTLVKDQGTEDLPVSPSQMRALFNKVNRVDVPYADMVSGADQNSPEEVKKLFRIVDHVTEMQRQIDLLSYKKDELQSILSIKVEEIEHLKGEVETYRRTVETHSRTVEPEIVQQRGIFMPPTASSASELSEDTGLLMNKPVHPIPSTAPGTTMRKGSTDQLAINIDSDEDKGHAFKSLNLSGLIPRQGKMIADRIDGMWVSGGRVLMSRPRARLGLIAYWLVLHLWLLGTLL